MTRRIQIVLVFVGLLALSAAALAQTGRYGGHALEFGNRDSDFAADYVTLLQTDLSKLGYDDYLLKDGKLESAFGPGTEGAVKAFQRDWGLPVTGVVGAETTAALERALAGERPESAEPPPKLTLLESTQITIKPGKKGTYDIKPVKGTTYVISCGGDCLEANVVNPYEAYSPVATPPPDVRYALAELGDDGKAVIFNDVPFPGKYFVEIEPLNDLKDTPVLLRIYELTR
jgi:peptidoglycan hydrolase-like protein with peptidoglycan-binding domain